MKVQSRDESLNTSGECDGSNDLLTGKCTLKPHTSPSLPRHRAIYI